MTFTAYLLWSQTYQCVRTQRSGNCIKQCTCETIKHEWMKKGSSANETGEDAFSTISWCDVISTKTQTNQIWEALILLKGNIHDCQIY